MVLISAQTLISLFFVNSCMKLSYDLLEKVFATTWYTSDLKNTNHKMNTDNNDNSKQRINSKMDVYNKYWNSTIVSHILRAESFQDWGVTYCNS